MKKKRRKAVYIFSALAALLAAAAVTAALLGGWFAQRQFELLGRVFRTVEEQSPRAGQALLDALKEEKERETDEDSGAEYLQAYGYRARDFLGTDGRVYGAAGAGFLAAVLLFLFAFLGMRRRQERQIQGLLAYLEKEGTGQQGSLTEEREDAFSLLRDEIAKTVAALEQTRDRARRDRDSFAASLADMAHQMKTPVTAISLAAQRMRERGTLEGLPAVERQTARLVHLEETLLLMSRMDAGALSLHREETDVYSLLELSAENLEDICRQRQVRIRVPLLPAAALQVDREWTLEAVMNLMKNCLEHSTAGGEVSCDWEENPLYIRIRIWDQGEGFSEKDLPHLFERFYRGERAGRDSTGLGLFLAREILEAQDGVLEAYNRPGGGACFEIRMYRYCH
ncbi:sensor histidine kinase [Lachnoclostridium sp. An118]|uniref:sensor histidine kinase n=1 Tax=Lachnoclostridium sp. An118 TaxID=1965547 RepID=UPI000B392179|nr:HAMP domain-containing sensor histidine kinase [Lachnoclostridium sp. An118]OUQ48288.1 hypothetical protein B5E62_13940 [Lachnoclostridium sp. An118]